jgi:hypothetical protein
MMPVGELLKLWMNFKIVSEVYKNTETKAN